MDAIPTAVVVDRSAAVRAGTVDADIIAMMEGSALDVTHARKLKLRLADREEVEGMGRKFVKTCAIPYFDLDGNTIEFTRYRYLQDPRTAWQRIVTDSKAQRYFQPAGTDLHPYFPPLVDWRALANDATKTLIITEGEKKAASATAHGFPCIGLGGVDCFATRKVDAPLLPELMEFKWEGRDVVIMYDSDAAMNPNVLAASVRLGRRLIQLRASVRIAAIPPAKDGAKQGVDDLIAAAKHAGESPRAVLQALIDKANADLFERELALYDFNGRFVYIRDLDKVLVREDHAMLYPDAFVKRAYAGEKHREFSVVLKKDGSSSTVGKPVSTAAAWMEWPGRLTVKTLGFDPREGEFFDGKYNLWTGWATESVEGDVSLWTELLDKLFSNTIPADRQWFERWCAYPIQNPGAKLKTAVLIWSKAEGTGKSTVLEALRCIYGPLFASMNDSAVDLQWTDWLVNKLMVGVDDIQSKNRDDHAGKWKNLITANEITINKRHTHSFEIPSFVNFIMTSNDANALRLSPQDRRHFVHEAAAWGTREEREEFFDRFYKWLKKDGGHRALLHHLANLDTTGFNPDANAPITIAKMEMQDMSKGPVERWVDNLKEAPDAMLRLGAAPVPGDLHTSDDLVAIYNARDPKNQISSTTMGMALNSAGIHKVNGGVQIRLTNQTRVRLYAVRNAEKWMKATSQALKEHYEETHK